MFVENSETLLRVMYSSVSSPTLTRDALLEIYAQSKLRNQARAITSVWVSNKRLNIQYFEGPQDAVRQLWVRLQADTRHHSIVQLAQQLIAGPRLFPDSALLHGPASRQDMLALVRSAYERADALSRPDWAKGIGPLMILLDGEFSHAYAAPDDELEL
jgi:hypothetical protein